MKKIYLLLLVLVTLFVACKKDRDVEFSTFTVEDENIVASYTSMDLSCKVRCAATINEFYLQYDTVADFSTYQEVELVENKKTDVYSVKIDDLLDNTTYYVRYVAVNSFSQVTSEEISQFQTLKATIPTIEVREIIDVLDTIATVGFVLKFDGGVDVEKMGVCWSVDSVPTIDSTHVVYSIDAKKGVVDGDSLFMNISELKANTTYYVRAYAENKIGIGYSMSKSFLTLSLPEVITSEVTNIKFESAILNGEAVFNGNDTTTVYGFCWGEVSMPTFEYNYIQVKKENFSYKLSNLKPETIYYVRAYAKNKIGVVYGEEISFRTLTPEDYFYDYVCEGYEYVGYGFRVNAIDITGDTILSRIDNDSIISLYLEYIPTKVVDTTVFIKEGDYYEFGEKTLTEGGVYKETFITSLGCDSIVNLTLVVYNKAVDLGLSVKWATCNVGATKPEEYGDYFAWGEVEPKEKYDWKTYLYCKGTVRTMTKYCNNSEYGYNGFTDNKAVLDPEDDVAHVNWGGAWRMPTKAEMTELREKCTWKWTTQNGVNGYKVIGPNGNSIFLPAAGYMVGGTFNGAGSDGYYWSSSLYTDVPGYVYYVYFDSDYVGWSYYSRYCGLSVRPVYGESSQQPEIKRYTISVYSHDNSRGTVSGGGTYNEGYQVTITATANEGYKFKEWNDGNTDNPRIITVTKDAIYTAHFEEEKNLNAGHEYVDLGLSVKWATCNVGATTPEDYGDYFAWGETTPKENYDWTTYKYCKGTDETMTKYCNNSSYGNNGFTDNKTVLDPEDDAATANWGGAWRMPTKVEQDELRNNCTWTWTTQNGIWGYKVIGPNGNSIFLPATGYMIENKLYNAASYGCYWSSSLFAGLPYDSYDVRFKLEKVYWDLNERYYGLSVRPVYGESSQQPETKRYTISVYSHDNSRGTVSGGGTYNEGYQVTITATANEGYKFKEWNDGNTDNPRVITVTKDAIYTAHFEEEKNLNAGHEYVDLGLPSGLKWATCNVGATKPEEYGDYFAWGEVEPKDNYSWSTYKYCYGSYDTMNKYYIWSNGLTDNKIVLDAEDDVATVKWGGAWRMPTKVEQDELRNNCLWMQANINGVYGYKVIGTNGNSIFLPATGWMQGRILKNVGSIGLFFSNTLVSDISYVFIPCGDAYNLRFDSYGVDWNYIERSNGLVVRPVCK